MKILSEKEAVPDAVQILRQPGSVLLVPTETVYGLVCAWEDTAARKRIYELKHRSENKPFAAFIPCVDALPPEATLPDAARKIAEAFCPGPVTVIVPDRRGGTFGFRIPDHPFITCMEDGLNSIDGEPALAVDGGVLPPDSLASTVIMVGADSSWKILRQGPVTEEQIRQTVDA